jgi:uncharacterized BrkB/YihY/UPF0761 family membrane protein
MASSLYWGKSAAWRAEINAGELVSVIDYQVSQFSNGPSQATIVLIGHVHTTVATSNAVMKASKAQSNKIWDFQPFELL